MAANMASSTAAATAFANDKQQPRQSHRNILTHTIPTTNNDIGTIDLHVFEPPSTSSSPSSPSIVDIPNDTNETDAGSLTGTIITVHPWSFLGGGEHNTIGLAKHLLHCQNRQSSIRRLIPRGRVAKWRVVTFALRSTPVFWKGGAVGGILGRHRCEVRQIVDVVDWVANKYYHHRYTSSPSDSGRDEDEARSGSGLPIVLLGSSAGAPMAGSAMDLILRRQRDEERRRRRNRQRRQEVEEHAEELPENQKETFRDEITTNDDDCNKMYFHRGNLVSAYIAIGYTFGKFASLGFGRHFSSLFGPSANSSSTSWCFAKTAVSPNSDDNADDDDDIHNGQPHKLFIMGENDEFTSPSQLEHWAHKIRLSNNPQSSADTKNENRGGRKNNKEDHHHVRPLVVDGDRRRSNRRECRVDTKIIPHVGHFELESPGYNGLVANLIMEWLNDVLSV